MRKNKTIALFLAFSFLISCQKDLVTVEKNNDLNKNISNKLINEDIRTRIGYDPQDKYVYLSASEISAPIFYMSSSQGQRLSAVGTEKYEVKAVLAGAIDKDVLVALEYNPNLLENQEIKEKYIDYVLGAEDLLKIKEKEKTISKDKGSIKFDLEVTPNSYVDKKTVLPFSLKIKTEGIKNLDPQHLFVKLEPKQVNLKVEPNEIIKELIIQGDQIAAIGGNEITFECQGIGVGRDLPSDITVKALRGENSTSMELAPEGIEGELPTVSFTGINTASIAFELTNLEILKTKGADKNYILPLDLEIERSGKKIILTGAQITIKVTKAQENARLTDAYFRARDKVTAHPGPRHTRLIDDSDWTTSNVANQEELNFRFPNRGYVGKVRGIHVLSQDAIESIKIFSSRRGEKKLEGEVKIPQDRNKDFKIEFIEPFKFDKWSSSGTDYNLVIVLKSVTGANMRVGEIKVYEP
ncbi:DUF1735 domain-containing protein [Capnocytophaga canimorsus]|uniref:DUF1735 domain-containing protein n=1 Tax=Capnocytophaga canimorsus TaxID=28188 RepID=UPI001AC8D120|nr:DUF1735 domain-containing protein [Capnocytophaga canimorsus]GIM58456.1 hypothetical protein CAPN007_06630 [Capnocytophaga canimorsus]